MKVTSDLNLYPDDLTGIDTIGESGYTERLYEQFGRRILRGTALCFCESSNKISHFTEPFLRAFLSQLKPKKTVEIGVLNGATTALLAHYSNEVVAIDISYQQVASYIWRHFGVADKIKLVIVQSDEDKKELLANTDFDFAFVDGEHTFEAVKFDFECVKKCGVVLFHDYCNPEVVRFIKTLPKDEVLIMFPFAYWEKK